MGVTITKDKVADIIRAVAELAGKDVLVGVPDSKAERTDDQPISNAAIGYIMETGSPANNIPARPHLVPGIQDVQAEVAERLGKGARAALSGSQSGANAQLNAAGLIGQRGVRAKITDGPFAPLAESTLRARARCGRKGAAKELASRAAGNQPDNANAKPLIDTGQYRQSITYVVRKR
ncbi:hypothetical protein G3N58_17625 [Paraburkholderia sp. Ac-20342]|uniref:hypothetical protein n=1 Tax=Paraburkholderia sp. Ac-20342 TaxID=2703889 RepID=UPI00197E51DC|nr:hypothetical protein [Paraburkholderia sp. Ac-20342]MBN3848628.1 hypothetical protein [Paraburkholderia sp. Ac-20342]